MPYKILYWVLDFFKNLNRNLGETGIGQRLHREWICSLSFVSSLWLGETGIMGDEAPVGDAQACASSDSLESSAVCASLCAVGHTERRVLEGRSECTQARQRKPRMKTLLLVAVLIFQPF